MQLQQSIAMSFHFRSSAILSHITAQAGFPHASNAVMPDSNDVNGYARVCTSFNAGIVHTLHAFLVIIPISPLEAPAVVSRGADDDKIYNLCNGTDE